MKICGIRSNKIIETKQRIEATEKLSVKLQNIIIGERMLKKRVSVKKVSP